MVGNGCVLSEGLVDWMLHFTFFFTYFSMRLFFLPMNERIGRGVGTVCEIKGGIGFFVFENKCFTGKSPVGINQGRDVQRLQVLRSALNSMSST